MVPRFMAGLERIGAAATRVPAYLTTPGLPGAAGLAACAAERRLLEEGEVHAIVFSSTAEVWFEELSWMCFARFVVAEAQLSGSCRRRVTCTVLYS